MGGDEEEAAGHCTKGKGERASGQLDYFLLLPSSSFLSIKVKHGTAERKGSRRKKRTRKVLPGKATVTT